VVRAAVAPSTTIIHEETPLPKSLARSSCSFGFAALALLLSAGAARAATIPVRTTNMTVNGSDGCGLAEALVAVNEQRAYSDCPAGNGSSDTITLRVGIGTYTIPFGIYVERSMIIRSETAGIKVTIVSNGMDLDAINCDSPAVNLQLQDIDLRAGAADYQTGVYGHGTNNTKVTVLRSTIHGFGGVGILVSFMDLDIIDSIIEYNNGEGVGGPGGGVSHHGDSGTVLNIRHSQISDNWSSVIGGGVRFSGGGASSIVNSTISHNFAPVGAGLDLQLPSGAGLFSITASTIAKNSASERGGGVSSGGISNVRVAESIVGNNDAPLGADWYGTISTLVDSLVQSTANTTITTNTHNLIGSDPGFVNDAIPWYAGGPYYTRVMVLAPNSPAVDFNTSSSQTEDQRHFTRPVDLPGFNLADIGAVELDPNTQTEFLTVTAKSSDTHSVVTAPQFTNGKGTNLQSNALNDFVTYDFPMIIDDCADISVGVRRMNNGGRVKMEYKTKNSNWITVGPVLDLWASTPTFKQLSVATNFRVVLDSTLIRFTVVGKNNASSGYQMSFDYIKVTRNPTGGCF
jgi:hypothetical protein